MQITFNLMGVSLGPNGGSFTLIKSANMLQNLGHVVTIIDTSKSKCNWAKLEVEHVIVRNNKDIPNADIVIATGYKTYKPTINLPNRCGRKFVWVRGWEVWNASEQKLVSVLSDPRMVKIVNSIGLYNKLYSYNVESHIIRPGNDFEDFFPMNNKQDEGKIRFGGLYHTRHKTKRTDWILKVVKNLKETFKDKEVIQLWMFGTGSGPPYSMVDRYFQLPDIQMKNMFYNKVTIWLAPSSLEGLHIVPQEVMLTECPVVTTDAPLSGTQDYIQDMKTGLVSMNDMDHFTAKIEPLIQFPDLRTFLGKRGRKKIIELGDRKANMKKMISLFEDLL